MVKNKTPIRWTEDSFRARMEEVHPKYNFENTCFIKSSEKVEYYCKIHGKQESYPRHLLNGSICRGCNKGKPFKLPPCELKNRCIRTHGDLYDYSLTSFDVSNIENEKSTFICYKHGSFEQTLQSHISGRGCNMCAIEIRKAKAMENPTGWSYTNWEISAKKSKNFESFKIYFIECWNNYERFYKVGKTYRTIEKRFKDKKAMPYNYDIIFTIELDNPRVVSEIEAYIKSYLHKYKPLINFNGSSECGYLSDVSWSKFFQMLQYKANWYGKEVIKVNRYYASSKTCGCGVKNENLKLSDRVWTCNSCGTENSRDHLASQNILKEGRKSLGELALAKSEA